MKTRSMVAPVVRSNEVNLGALERKVSLFEGLRPLFKNAQGNESFMTSLVARCFNLTIPALADDSPDHLADFVPMIRVTWGNGQATVTGDFDCTYRRAVPFATSIMQVSAWICPVPAPGTNVPIGPGLLDGPTTRPRGSSGASNMGWRTIAGITDAVAKGVVGDFELFHADGQELDDAPNLWITQFGINSGVVAKGQNRVIGAHITLTANPGAVTPLFLVWCDSDTAPVAGPNAPLVVAAQSVLPLNSSGVTGFNNTRPFQQGSAWCLSSSATIANPVVGATCILETNLRL